MVMRLCRRALNELFAAERISNPVPNLYYRPVVARLALDGNLSTGNKLD